MQTGAPQRQSPQVCDVRTGVFRLNPDCEILLLDELAAEHQESLNALRQDASFYGVLRLRGATGLSAKAVTGDTAALLRQLKQPGPLPHHAFRDPDAELALTEMVWDGVLQVERDAEWICGPAACSVTAKDCTDPHGVLSKLSFDALKHASELHVAGATSLAGHLYRYNTLPLTPHWLRRIPDQIAINECLQIDPGGRNRRELDRNWVRVPPLPEYRAWLPWVSRQVPVPHRTTTYKLYLSPLPSELRHAFRVWLTAMTLAGAFYFKIGSDVRGLLRPDKMVGYFANRDSLEEAENIIAKELAGCPAQGVPFTAELNCGALTSWGSDPPTEEAMPPWLRQQSWRQWVCNRLGSALAVSKHFKSEAVPGWQFALERLRLDGVDVSHWVAGSKHVQWRGAAEAAVL